MSYRAQDIKYKNSMANLAELFLVGIGICLLFCNHIFDI